MTMLLRVMIVDDEAPARDGLRIRLRREADVIVLAEFADAFKALEAMAVDPPDLLFLDIQMPGMDGLSLAAKGKEIALPPIVFVTAHDQHAVKAFGLRALDYLLKPVEQERLHESLERAREYWDAIRKSELADRVKEAIGDGSAPAAASAQSASRGVARISVRNDGVITFVYPDDIDWIDAAGDSVRIHAKGQKHTIRKSMGEMIAMLDPARFIRIHRSTIVNIDRVRELQPYFHGEYMVVLIDGSRLKLSRGYRDQLAGLLGR